MEGKILFANVLKASMNFRLIILLTSPPCPPLQTQQRIVSSYSVWRGVRGEVSTATKSKQNRITPRGKPLDLLEKREYNLITYEGLDNGALL